MSTNDEIAAPMGTEAWDDTALLEVCVEMRDFNSRRLNELQQATINLKLGKKINCKRIHLFFNKLDQRLLLRRKRQLYFFSILY